MKINSVGLRLNSNINGYGAQKCNCPKPKMLERQIGATDVLRYMDATSISFKGQDIDKVQGVGKIGKYGTIAHAPQKAELTFEDTIDENYFQLPIIKTKKGNTVQAMPDKTQLACAESLYNGNNTVCIAPTGTGKTAIANYIITKNMDENKRTIYTTPLKALSNDKFREFGKIYGQDNIGLLTGDIKLNPNAPIVIMTTEIYRNMALDAYAKNDYGKFHNVNTVIFDEAHYISERERGKTWEESVMLTPPDVQILPLSATIGNGEEFTSWIDSVTSLPTNLVEASPKDRHVPLVYYNFVGIKGDNFHELIKGKVNIGKIARNFENDSMSQREIRAIDMLVQKRNGEDDDYHATKDEQNEMLHELADMANYQKMPHEQFSKVLRKKFGLKELQAQEITQLLLDSDSRSIVDFNEAKFLKKTRRNDFKALGKALKEDGKLPALVFVFSRNICNDASAILADSSLNLTTQAEKEEIKKIIDEYKENGVYLGEEFSEKELLQGVAAHHAGLLPAYKKLVEELFSKKLVKVVFATSTLSAGINMPAKTVVITAIDRPTKNKKDEIKYIPLTSNEFHQMSGRAGRRGIDTIGNVVLYDIGGKDVEIAKNLILTSPDKAESAFSPSYSFLPAYYEKTENDDLLGYFQENTLKVYQSDSKEKTIKDLRREFNKYREILVDKGFLIETEHGFRPTTKGKMLVKAHGYNELTLVESIFNGNLKGLTAPELAGFAAAMGAEIGYAGDGNNNKLFAKYLTENTVNEDGESLFIDALDMAMDYDEETESLEDAERVKNRTTNKTGIFEASVAYAFAKANEEEPEESVQTFRTLGRKTLGKKFDRTPLEPSTRKGFEDGALYAKLAKSVDVLKQIINISEYALETCDEEKVEYYENLIKTADKAIELMSKPPIYDINAVQTNEN